MRLKKRNKRSRFRGTRLHGWAAKKHKGKGSKGGKGMAGTGKRADHRKSWTLVYMPNYFGKQGVTSKSTERTKNPILNLNDVEARFHKMKGKSDVLNLKGYKILGDGNIKSKVKVHAMAFSKSAKEKIEKAGGEVVVVENKSHEPKESNKEFLEEKRAAKQKEEKKK